MSHRALLVVLATLVALPSLARAQDGLHILLRAHVELAAPLATLGDIAELSGDPDLVARATVVPILSIPALGQHSIDPAMVRTQVAHVLPVRLEDITGTCLLSHRALVITPEQLVDAAIHQACSTTDTQASRVRDDGALLVPDQDGAPRLVADALDDAPSGEIPYRVRVLRGDQELARTLVVLNVTRYRTLVVASHDLQRGQTLGPGDMRTEHMVMELAYVQVPSDGTALEGAQVRADIKAGTPLAPGLLKPHADVHCGLGVTLVFRSANFEVSGAGEAMADGVIGQIIPVRRNTDGKLVKGRISAPGVVEVNF